MNDLLQDKPVETLNQLGFTLGQSKVYLAIIQCETATAVKQISKVSKLPRQEIYKIIKGLEKQGFVERIIGVPTTFKALSLKQTFSILIEQRKGETRNLEAATKRLLTEKTVINDEKPFEEEPDFLLIAGKERILLHAVNDTNKAKERLDHSSPWEMLMYLMSVAEDALVEAEKRGVTFRMLINKPDNERALSKFHKFATRHKRFQIRYGRCTPLAFVIRDHRVVSFSSLGNEFDLTKSRMLVSNNYAFAQLIEEYFNSIWAEASNC
jgi:sugar-specific transcriptional regulator TrmB